VGSSDERGAAIANDFLLCQIRDMSDPRLGRNEDDPRFAMSWDQISSLAASMQWSDLKGEVSKKLDEEKIKLERMRIPIDFEALGRGASSKTARVGHSVPRIKKPAC